MAPFLLLGGVGLLGMLAVLRPFYIMLLKISRSEFYDVRYYKTDLSTIENLHSLMEHIAANPQYIRDERDIENSRQKFESMMRDFMMWEMEPMSLHANFSLAGNYTSSLDQDGVGEGEKAPSNPSDALTFQEMYRERKLSPPWHPASVINAHFKENPGAAMPLVPPLPGEEASPSRIESLLDGNDKVSRELQVHIFAPALCFTHAKESEPASALATKEKAADLACVERQCSLLHSLQNSPDWKFLSALTVDTPLDCSSFDPSGASDQDRLRPIVFYIHGGGSVALSTRAYEKMIRRLANDLGPLADAVVVSVDYRLSPEHRFPVPIDDCLHAIKEVVARAEAAGLDANNLAILGDSAGGALAAGVVAEALRLPSKYTWISGLRHVALVYPSLCRGCPTRTHVLFGNELTLKYDIWFALSAKRSLGPISARNAFPPRLRRAVSAQHTSSLGIITDWRQVPMATPTDILARFPPTSIVLFTNDIQYDIGVLFHERLRRAGVKTSLYIAPGKHAFFGSDVWSRYGVESVEWTAERIAESFNTSSEDAVSTGGS